MSPTALFGLADAARGALVVMGTAGMVEEGCTRGGGRVGIPGGWLEGYTGVLPSTHPGPIFNHI